MGDNSVQPKETVLVTGFGPFGNHVINASWVAVQELEKLGINEDVHLIVEEIPVEYEAVKSSVPHLWEKYKPKLTVHVGVSGIAKELTLEQQAHNDGYDKLDVCGTFPESKCCIEGAACHVVSQLDMSQVCESINKCQCGVDAVVSLDPGRYLCDFIYYTSLNVDKSCTAFIHVPPLNKPYTAQQLAMGIQLAIINMLEQLK